MDILYITSFWFAALFLIIASLLTVFIPKISYSVLFAFITFILFAMIFFLLNSPFNAAVQIAIYAVTVSVLFAIAVMLTNSKKDEKKFLFISPRFFVTLIGIFLAGYSVFGIIKQDLFFGLSEFLNSDIFNLHDASNSVDVLGTTLFTKYILAFELLSILLLIGVVGIFLAVSKHGKKEGIKNE